MTQAADYESKRDRRDCQSCREGKARTLCFECYRIERDRRRAHALADVPLAPPMSSPFHGATTSRQTAHRERMLAHLMGTRALSLTNS